MNRSLAALVALYLLLYLVPLGVRPLSVPDEARYAEIPREMLASGDWVVPRLNGILYFEKPVMAYWLNAAAMLALGENRFAVRLPSALATGLSALMVLLLVARHGGERDRGILAAAVLLTTAAMLGLGTFNSPDAVLTLFLTAAMAVFLHAHLERNRVRRSAWLAVFGGLCGLAFLTKGFLAFAVPGVALVPFLMWERRWKELLTLPWIPALAAFLVALPWAVMIHVRQPEFWNYFVWVEHIRRFASSTPQHEEPFWYYVPVLAAGAFLWTALVPAALMGSRFKAPRKPLFRFAVCWLVFPFLFFSASRGKLGTYILPCFPPLAILVAAGVTRYLDQGRHRAFSIGAVVPAVAGGLFAIAVVAVQTVLPEHAVYTGTETARWVLAVAGILGTVFLLAAAATRRRLGLFCAAAVPFLTVAAFIVPERTREGKMPGAFIRAHADDLGPETRVVSDRNLAAMVCWTAKRSDVYLLEAAGEYRWGLDREGAASRLLSVEQARELAGDGRPVAMILSRRRFDQYSDRLPEPRSVDVFGDFTFARFRRGRNRPGSSTGLP